MRGLGDLARWIARPWEAQKSNWEVAGQPREQCSQLPHHSSLPSTGGDEKDTTKKLRDVALEDEQSEPTDWRPPAA